ncbi:MAG TPA: hypothetical protein VN802_10820 [Stellaceae bacterium]|nr:hypothetical protein [Stellaceae bacterium]
MDGSRPPVVTDDDLRAAFTEFGAQRCRAAVDKVISENAIRSLREIPQAKRAEFLAVLHQNFVAEGTEFGGPDPSGLGRQSPSASPECAADEHAVGEPKADLGEGERMSANESLEPDKTSFTEWFEAHYARRAVAEEHVRQLTGDAGAPVEFRATYRYDDSPLYSTKCFYGTVRQHWVEIGNLNRDRYDISIVPNPGRTDGKASAHSRQEFTAVRVVALEMDRLPAQWHLAPSFIVGTSPGRGHAYWRVTGITPTEFNTIQKRAHLHYGDATTTGCSDPEGLGIHHPLRLAGTVRFKPGQAANVVTIEPSANGIYSCEQFLAGLPDITPEPERAAGEKSAEAVKMTVAQFVAAATCISPMFNSSAPTGYDASKMKFPFGWGMNEWVGFTKLLLDEDKIALAGDGAEDFDRLAFVFQWSSGEAWNAAHPDAPVHPNCPADHDALLKRLGETATTGEVYHGGTFIALACACGYEGEFGSRPVICVRGGDLEQVVDAAETALIEHDAPIYQRGQSLVLPGRVVVEVHDGAPTEAFLLVNVTEPTVIETLTSAAKFQKWNERKKGWKTADCPPMVAKALLARVGRWRAKPLLGTTDIPLLRRDGTLHTEPGYDAQTGMFCHPGGYVLPPIPDKPTKADAGVALKVFDDLIGEFPFVADADKAVAIAAFLTGLIRRTLPTAPLFLFGAPAPGSGKGLLCDTISIVTCGRAVGTKTFNPNSVEMEKVLASALLAGHEVLHIDNVSAALTGDLFASLLTQEHMSIRILGQTKEVSLPTNALILANGNNAHAAADLTRRVVQCYIDPKCETPNTRHFEFDPKDRAKENRGKFIAAGLTIVRAYIAAGEPEVGGENFGSYVTWCKRVRDPLIWLGLPDIQKTSPAGTAADPARERNLAVLKGWHDAVGIGCEVTTKKILEMAAQAAQHGKPEFKDALAEVAPPPFNSGQIADAQKLGYWLRDNQNAVVGGYHVVKAGISAGSPRWRLEQAEGAGESREGLEDVFTSLP